MQCPIISHFCKSFLAYIHKIKHYRYFENQKAKAKQLDLWDLISIFPLKRDRRKTESKEKLKLIKPLVQFFESFSIIGHRNLISLDKSRTFTVRQSSLGRKQLNPGIQRMDSGSCFHLFFFQIGFCFCIYFQTFYAGRGRQSCLPQSQVQDTSSKRLELSPPGLYAYFKYQKMPDQYQMSLTTISTYFLWLTGRGIWPPYACMRSTGRQPLAMKAVEKFTIEQSFFPETRWKRDPGKAKITT